MRKLRILINGSSGMVGRHLKNFFEKEGHSVYVLARHASSSVSKEKTILWNIKEGNIQTERLEDFDAVIHLAGASIAGRRWSPAYKKEILNSRVEGTTLLCEALRKLHRPPSVFFCASAIGFYGHRSATERVDETASVGSGFLPQVCSEWEKAAMTATNCGARVVCLRFAMIVSPKGGALAKMLPIFKLGLGGVLGSGEQMMSWVALPEIPSIVLHLLAQEKLSGVVNVVSPQAVSNSEFTKILGKVLGRPVFLPVPALGVKILFGEMGQELLLDGAHVIPRRLQESGYQFIYSDLHRTLTDLLK